MSIVKVRLRQGTLRLAADWARTTLAERPSIREKLVCDSLKFLLDLEKRGRRKGKVEPKIQMPRAFADRFVSAWGVTFRKWTVEPPDPGLEAIRAIVAATARALRPGAGRPHKVDPLEAFDRYEFHRATRERGPQQQTSVDRAASDLGASPRTVDAAIACARPVVQGIQEQQAAGNEVLGVLVDWDSGSRVMVVRGKKKPLI